MYIYQERKDLWIILHYRVRESKKFKYTIWSYISGCNYYCDSNMQSKNGSKKLAELLTRWVQFKYVDARAIKMYDMYGSWGMSYAFYVGPFLSLIPLLVLVLMFIVFKRRKLLGVTQKFILSIIGMGVCFTMTSAVRDSLLKMFQKHYGFLEYNVCAQVVFSFRIQSVFVATATWLNTLMLLHQVILLGFPLKAKLHNLTAYFFAFIVFHVVLCLSLFVLLNFPSFEPLPLMQEYQPGYPVKLIEGCDPHRTSLLDKYFSPNSYVVMAYFILLHTKVFPLTLHVITMFTLSIILIRQVRTLSILMHNVSVQRVKYIRLLKVNLVLGVSFLAQELPVTVMLCFQFFYFGNDEDVFEMYTPYIGITNTVMSISYCIGKPVDLLIYASLSKTFRDELKQLLSLGCKSKGQVTKPKAEPSHGK